MDGEERIVLGLIWTLIVQFQIKDAFIREKATLIQKKTHQPMSQVMADVLADEQIEK